MLSKLPRHWKALLIIIFIMGVFSLYILFFLTYYPGFHPQSKAIIDIGDVREAQRITKNILNNYWSEAGRLRVYSIDVFWSKKDLSIRYDKYDLNYTYSFQRFIMNKVMGQIIQETWLYSQWPHHPWDNVTWIQYDKIYERLLIYHNGLFWGDEGEPGLVNLLFYIDRYRAVIVNAVPAEYCLPNFTTFKYNGTYIKLPNPCSPEDCERLRFYYIYFRPPYIIAFTEPYDDELAPVYIANIVVITHNETDKAFLDKLFENYVNVRIPEFINSWINRYNNVGISITPDTKENTGDIYFDLRKVRNTTQNNVFFTQLEKNITNIFWHEVIKPVLKQIHVHANSLEDIMFAILINKHEVIYLEPIIP